ncbi:MAG: DASS family sodium-coupled anion symporter [Candidatus Eisenbacteria sp.]|nr:DASS family sodium-coupled anion symporter [Candidatus Eisenbacteria bacterium]
MSLLFGQRRGFLIAGFALALVSVFVFSNLPMQQRIMVSIFVLTVFYWITEPIPLYVTGIIAAFASGVLLGPMAKFTGAPPLDYQLFLYPFASPVVVLMFGGFVMAEVFTRNYLDIEFCQLILSRLGTRPSVVLFGMMLITALISMWMSNTATTAIMVATVLPLVRALPAGTNLPRAMMLAIPFSANIGGIATPIGTPPNAIAIGLLAEEGIHISFLGWMFAGFPLMIVMLVVCFVLLRIFFPIREGHLKIDTQPETNVANRTLVYTTFFCTIILWLTDVLHGIPSALIALVPVLVFSIAGLLPKRRMREIPWDILLLIGGGLSLGAGIKQTGLAETIVGSVFPAGMTPFGMLILMCGAITLLATFMSNTAASNIILPLVLSMAGALPAEMAIPVALCASFGMALPVSTPPNAIAYGSELIRGNDMFKVGVLISVIGILVTLVYQRALFEILPSVFLGG